MAFYIIFDANMSKKGNIDEIAKAFGVSVRTIRSNSQRDGFPKAEDGVYDLEKIVTWVISRPESKRSKMWEAATRLLAEGKIKNVKRKAKNAGKGDGKREKQDKGKPGKPYAEDEPPSLDSAEEGDLEAAEALRGEDVAEVLEPIVSKLSGVVDSFADLSMDNLSKGNAELCAYYVKLLVPSIESLRKGIESTISVQQHRGELLRRDDAVHAFAKMASNVRGKLMVMTKKLSHELVGKMTPGEVQAILEDEVTEVLEGLSRNPFGDG